MKTAETENFTDWMNRIKTADQSGKRYISYISQISRQDPLGFLANALKLFPDEVSYWAEPGGESIMIGAGILKQMASSGPDRNQRIQKDYRQLTDQTIRNIQLNQTGPVMLGGFQFDPDDHSQFPDWSGFGETDFIIHRYLLTVTEDRCYFTTNMEIDGEDLNEKAGRETENKYRLFSAGKHAASAQPESKQAGSTPEKPDYINMIKQATDAISQTDLEKVVLSRCLSFNLVQELDLLKSIEVLMKQNNTSYIFLFQRGGKSFVGATPEKLIKKEKERLKTMCLAGTIKRGETPEADEALGRQLLFDPKNRWEHQLVVEHISEAMKKVTSRLDVTDQPSIYKANKVQHLYTPLEGESRSGYSVFDLIEQLHPTPALGGAPKNLAVDFIRRAEPYDRGWYGAPVGWVDSEGDADFAVAIRSALIDGKRGYIFAGGGIVEDSDPDEEYIESEMKALQMTELFGGVER